MELFRTVAGVYVVHRVGMSRVYHTADCDLARTNSLPYGHEMPDPITQSAVMKLTPCATCRPARIDPPSTLRFERERHWAGIANNADHLVAMVHRTDEGRRSLPWIAANLLSEAARSDATVADAYSVERI